MRSLSMAVMLRDLKRRADGPGVHSDSELLARFLSHHDESAFELLVWRHGGMVFRVCRGLLTREQDAEDAFQAAFLILARDAGRIGRRESLAGWLYRVAHRLSCRMRKKHKPLESLDAEPTGRGREPSEAAIESERCRTLLDEIAELPDRYREAVVVCGLEGKSHSQAARELGCPTGTIDSRMAWARSRLRNRLIRRGMSPAIAIPAGVVLAAAPARLVAALPHYAVTLARGGPSAIAGVVSANTFTLLQGMSSMMTTKKVLIAAGCLIVAAVIGIGSNGRTDAPMLAQEPGPSPRQADVAAPNNWHVRHRIQAGNGPVHCLMFTPNGTQLLSTIGDTNSQAGRVSFWDVESGRETLHWNSSRDLRTLAFSPDGEQLLAVEPQGRLTMRDTASGKIVWDFDGFKSDRISSLTISPDGRRLAVGSADGKATVRWLDFTDNSPPILRDVPMVSQLLTQHAGPVHSVAFTPDGKRIATTQRGKVIIWDAATGKQIRSIDAGERQSQPLIAPDGKSVIVGWDSQLAKLDLATGKLMFTSQFQGLTIAATSQSPDGKLVAVALHGEKDGSYVVLIDSRTGKQIAKLAGHSQPVRRLAFSPDGKLLASGDESGQVVIWERGASGIKTATSGDRIDRLIDDLIRAGRGNDHCVEALFLATLGRLPQETEARLISGPLAKAQDRREALRNVAFMLTHTKEFGEHVSGLEARKK